MLKGPAAVSVSILPLPHAVPDQDVVWKDCDEGHDAFYEAAIRYDRLAAGDGAFPTITGEDWRDIEDALDVEHALDVP